MSLIFSEEQEMIADMAAKFAADKLAPIRKPGTGTAISPSM